MLKSAMVFLLLMLIWTGCKTDEQNVFKGKVTTVDGRPPAKAHVHVYKIGQDPFEPLVTAETQKDGSYRIILPDEEMLEVMVTAAYHQMLQFPLIREDTQQSVEIHTQLQALDYLSAISQVKITGNWNDFGFSSAQPMMMQPDSTFIFLHKTAQDTILYQLVGIEATGRSVNGTDQQNFVYDGGGDYQSLIVTQKNEVTITFDPAKLPGVKPGLPIVHAGVEGTALNEFIDIALRTQKALRKARIAEEAFRAKEGNTEKYYYDMSQLVEYLREKTRSSHGNVAKYAGLQLGELVYYDVTLPDTVFKQIATLMPLTDPMWSAKPQMTSYVYNRALGEEKAMEIFESQIDQITDGRVRSIILVSMGLKAKRENNTEKLQKIYTDLKQNHGDIAEVEYYLKQFNPDQRIMKNKPVPEFKVTLLDGKTTVSSASLKGKYYIMDFWATWCKPCIAEMPKIHEIYDRYKSKNFTILSLSYDRQRGDIDSFRRNTWKMPWLHTYLEGEKRAAISQKFEVYGIPKPILVGPDGMILATDSELRGDQLAKTLEKYLP